MSAESLDDLRPLLRHLNLIAEGDARNVHSVLIQRSVDFTIYLPPVRIRDIRGVAGQ
jgi:hypothetical protein